MTQIISFSADTEFASGLEELISKSGYSNRSRFIRDASLFYAEMQQRGLGEYGWETDNRGASGRVLPA